MVKLSFFFFPNRTILASMLRSDGGKGRKGVCSEWEQRGLMRDEMTRARSTLKVVGVVRHGCILDILKTEPTIFAKRLDLRC